DLDEWARERRRQKRPDAEWRHLHDLAERLDGGEQRREVRRLRGSGTLAAERIARQGLQAWLGGAGPAGPRGGVGGRAGEAVARVGGEKGPGARAGTGGGDASPCLGRGRGGGRGGASSAGGPGRASGRGSPAGSSREVSGVPETAAAGKGHRMLPGGTGIASEPRNCP